MSYNYKIYLAKKFRYNQTFAEKIMWNNLRNRKFLNLKFKRQYITLGYIIDFYCPELKLAIEIDGLIHNKQKKQDMRREKIINKRKIKFIRFKNDEI